MASKLNKMVRAAALLASTALSTATTASAEEPTTSIRSIDFSESFAQCAQSALEESFPDQTFKLTSREAYSGGKAHRITSSEGSIDGNYISLNVNMGDGYVAFANLYGKFNGVSESLSEINPARKFYPTNIASDIAHLSSDFHKAMRAISACPTRQIDTIGTSIALAGMASPSR